MPAIRILLGFFGKLQIVEKPTFQHMQGILDLYNDCKDEFVLPVPETLEELMAKKEQMLIAVDPTENKVLGIIEYWTMENGGLTEKKIKAFTSSKVPVPFDEDIAAILIENPEVVIHMKRMLVHPDVRRKKRFLWFSLAKLLKFFGSIMVFFEGFDIVIGMIRVLPDPNWVSSKVRYLADTA